jgi:Ca-activated chloride channel homolog
MSGIAETTQHNTTRPAAALLRLCALAALACVLAAPLVRADDLADQISAANKLMQSGKPQEALSAYSAAAEKAGEAAPSELLFNRACAQLAADQLPDAETGFRSVLTKSGSETLRASANYNLGLIESRHADSKQDTALPEAIDHLRRAERFFRAANASATDPDAARNIDLVQRRIAALLDKQKQQDQQKKDEDKQDKSKQDSKDNKSKDQRQSDQKSGDQSKSDEKNQQQNSDDQNLSDDLNKLADQQEQQSKQSNSMTKQSEQGAPKEQMADQQKKAADQQSDLHKKTEEAKKQAEAKSGAAQDKGQKDALDQTKDKLDKATQAQQQAEEKLKQGDTKGAEEKQKEAAQQLRDAAQQAKSAEEAKQKQDAAQEQAAKQQQGEDPQGKPFDATAAQILDQERRDKQMRDRMMRQRVRPAPVPKDW